MIIVEFLSVLQKRNQCCNHSSKRKYYYIYYNYYNYYYCYPLLEYCLINDLVFQNNLCFFLW